MITPLSTPESPGAKPARDPELWAAAQSLESTFIAEMLKTAGVGAPRDNFGGGAGEASFSSFLTDEYAASVTRSGGLGIAESIYQSLSNGGVSDAHMG